MSVCSLVLCAGAVVVEGDKGCVAVAPEADGMQPPHLNVKVFVR